MPPTDYRYPFLRRTPERRVPGLALAGVGVAMSLGARTRAVAGPAPARPLCRPRRRPSRTSRRVPPRRRPASQSPRGPCSEAGGRPARARLVFPDILALGARALAVVVAVVAITFVGTCWAGRQARLSPTTSRCSSHSGSRSAACRRSQPPTASSRPTRTRSLRGRARDALRHARDRHAPPLRGLLGLDDEQFGAWVGASVHDVAQVVATSSTAGSIALATAIVVKLTRVMLLAPLIAGIALSRRRPRLPPGARPPLVRRSSSPSSRWSRSRASTSSPPECSSGSTTSAPCCSALALFALGTRFDIDWLARIGTAPTRPRPRSRGR